MFSGCAFKVDRGRGADNLMNADQELVPNRTAAGKTDRSVVLSESIGDLNGQDINPTNQNLTVSWKQAKKMVSSGDVKCVNQYESLLVLLELKDGRKVETTEPHIDDIFKIIRKCGSKCKDIVLITE